MNRFSNFKNILYVIALVLFSYLTFQMLNDGSIFHCLKMHEKYVYKIEEHDNDWTLYKNVIVVSGKPNKLVRLTVDCDIGHDEYGVFLYLKRYEAPEKIYTKYTEEVFRLDENGEKEIPVIFAIKDNDNLDKNAISMSVKYVK